MADDDGFDDESLLASVIAAERDAGAAWTSGEPKSAPAALDSCLRRGVGRCLRTCTASAASW